MKLLCSAAVAFWLDASAITGDGSGGRTTEQCPIKPLAFEHARQLIASGHLVDASKG
ncbi:MAG TPA: hypothetical protein VM717_01005 [Chthoniobacterales bacterium]|jgi:hypothetical protein|nr:hypothetical protein [Chthoniobacterales bacterium]